MSAKQLRRALHIKERLDTLENELKRLVAAPWQRDRQAKRTMSAAARAKIAATQRARWAKRKRRLPATPAKKVRRKLSPQGRAKLAALAKARWAKLKAAGKKSLGS